MLSGVVTTKQGMAHNNYESMLASFRAQFLVVASVGDDCHGTIKIQGRRSANTQHLTINADDIVNVLHTIEYSSRTSLPHYHYHRKTDIALSTHFGDHPTTSGPLHSVPRVRARINQYSSKHAAQYECKTSLQRFSNQILSIRCNDQMHNNAITRINRTYIYICIQTDMSICYESYARNQFNPIYCCPGLQLG